MNLLGLLTEQRRETIGRIVDGLKAATLEGLLPTKTTSPQWSWRRSFFPLYSPPPYSVNKPLPEPQGLVQ